MISVRVGPTGMGLDAGAAEPPASQLGEGTHPAHSNISWLSWGSAVSIPGAWYGAPGQALGRLAVLGSIGMQSATPDPE